MPRVPRAIHHQVTSVFGCSAATAGPYGTDNRAAGWGARRCKIIEDAYGRFLSWRKLLETTGRHRSGDAHHAGRGCSVRELWMGTACLPSASACRSVRSAASHRHLRQMPAGLAEAEVLTEHRATPRRDKRTRVVPSALCTLGRLGDGTDGARHARPFFAASQYRDGLIIALMAARPHPQLPGHRTPPHAGLSVGHLPARLR